MGDKFTETNEKSKKLIHNFFEDSQTIFLVD